MTYKRYLYSDVPQPRSTAYRHRKKMEKELLSSLNSKLPIRENEAGLSRRECNDVGVTGSCNCTLNDPGGSPLHSSHEQLIEKNAMHSHKVLNNEDTEQHQSKPSPQMSGSLELEWSDVLLCNVLQDGKDDCAVQSLANAVEVTQDASELEDNANNVEPARSVPARSVPAPIAQNNVGSDQLILNEESNEQEGPLLPKTLCKCTSTSVGDALVMCLALGYRHNLTWVALVDVLEMINCLFDSNVLPASKYFFLKHMGKGTESVTYHLYCPVCDAYLGDKKSFTDEIVECMCGEKVKSSSAESYFLSVGLGEQIKDLLKRQDVVKGLNYRFDRVKADDDAIEDIYDGSVYKKLSSNGGILSSPLNFSYTFNTDGVPFGKSSKKTIWPIYVTINELPPNMRHKHMLLAGIWVANRDPNMSIFLKPFVEEANKLSLEGLSWTRNGVQVNSKIVPICAVVDSPARCRVLNMKQYNSYYGCTQCYQRTERTPSGRRFVIQKHIAPGRTHEGTVQDMIKAHQRRNHKQVKKRVVKGVRGPSALMALMHFNLISGMVPDYMHAILLGCIRLHMELLLSAGRKNYFVEKDVGVDHRIAAIDNRLTKICPPCSISRTPRTLQDVSLWRASEWRSWLVFYCVPCLQGILKPKYVQHMGMLSEAVTILLRKSISNEDLQTSHTLLLKYVFLFQTYFGETSMVYNIHLLIHVVDGVKNWGPLWTHNCFSYEGKNRHLLQLTKSPSHVASQVVRKFLTFNSLPSLCDTYASSDITIDFIESMAGKSMKFLVRSNGVVLPGSGFKSFLSKEEGDCLSSLGWNPSEVILFQRMISKNVRYSTWAYAAGKKIDNSHICVRGGMFGKIHGIVLRGNLKSDVIILMRHILVERGPLLQDQHMKLTHVKRVTGEGQMVAIEPREIIAQCVRMEIESGDFISEMPYGCYGD